MITHIAKRVLSIMLTACMLAASLALPVFAVDTWNPTEDTRIYVATDNGTVDVYDDNDEIVRYANLFAKEYESKLGVEPWIVYGAKENAHYNDIILDYDPEFGMEKDSYTITVFDENLIITASDSAGLFYGCRDMLKQLLVEDTVFEIPNNTPALAERAVSLDNGCQYFSPEWIKELICEMSWAGMNTLVMHFSEENGLEEEIRDIAEHAELYHVRLVPSSNDDSTQDAHEQVDSFTNSSPETIYNGWSPYVSNATYSEIIEDGALCIRCDHSTPCSEETIMEEIKPLLRAVAVKSWDPFANKNKFYSDYAAEWKKIGDAPKLDIPDDSAVQAAINEFYDTYLAKEDTYTAKSFSWYASEVTNAEAFIGLNSFRWSQGLFDILAEDMEYARDNLVPLGDTQALVNALATYDLYKDQKAIYSPESWSVFEASYLAGLKMLEGRNYEQKDVDKFVRTFSVIPLFMLDLEANVAHLRQEAIKTAGFMSSRMYQGGRAKVSVIIPRDINPVKVIVVDENGLEVSECVAQPIDIGKRDQVTYYGYFPADELGVHTYTVYAVFAYDKFTGTVGTGEGFLYCSDPIKLTLLVVE